MSRIGEESKLPLTRVQKKPASNGSDNVRRAIVVLLFTAIVAGIGWLIYKKYKQEEETDEEKKKREEEAARQEKIRKCTQECGRDNLVCFNACMNRPDGGGDGGDKDKDKDLDELLSTDKDLQKEAADPDFRDCLGKSGGTTYKLEACLAERMAAYEACDKECQEGKSKSSEESPRRLVARRLGGVMVPGDTLRYSADKPEYLMSQDGEMRLSMANTNEPLFEMKRDGTTWTPVPSLLPPVRSDVRSGEPGEYELLFSSNGQLLFRSTRDPNKVYVLTQPTVEWTTSIPFIDRNSPIIGALFAPAQARLAFEPGGIFIYQQRVDSDMKQHTWPVEFFPASKPDLLSHNNIVRTGGPVWRIEWNPLANRWERRHFLNPEAYSQAGAPPSTEVSSAELEAKTVKGRDITPLPPSLSNGKIVKSSNKEDPRIYTIELGKKRLHVLPDGKLWTGTGNEPLVSQMDLDKVDNGPYILVTPRRLRAAYPIVRYPMYSSYQPYPFRPYSVPTSTHVAHPAARYSYPHAHRR